MRYTIFTDGSSLGNPGAGGYAALIYEEDVLKKELQEGFYHTTNNRMELWAVIAGLKSLPEGRHDVCIYTDSQYVVYAVEKKWLDAWQKSHFKKKKNADLWKLYLSHATKHNVTIKWIRGHVGHRQNEQCDQNAKRAALRPTKHDSAYVGSHIVS